MIDLAFAGYRSIPAGPEDPSRVKWNAVRSLLALPASVAPVEPTLAAIAEANELINSVIKYVPEPDRADVWQTPAQTMLLKRGDCEDFAILKYALLQQAGVPVRLVVGGIASLNAPDGRRPHAWVAAFIDGAWCALDNKFDKIIRVKDYINWIPLASMQDDYVLRYGREFSINDVLKGA